MTQRQPVSLLEFGTNGGKTGQGPGQGQGKQPARRRDPGGLWEGFVASGSTAAAFSPSVGEKNNGTHAQRGEGGGLGDSSHPSFLLPNRIISVTHDHAPVI